MRIRRGPRPEEKFYVLSKSISEDPRLSWSARGVLIFLLGKPDNWEVSVKHLINQTKDAIGKASGRDAVRVILKELEEAGYLVADIARSENGVFNGMSYMINEVPVPVEPQTDNPAPAEPETENPAPAEPAPGNPHLIKTDSNQDTDTEVKTDKSDVCRVFDHWRIAMKSPRSRMDDKRKRLIAGALKNYSPDDLMQAIDGCAASPFHMGQNDRKEKYNGLDLIFRNADKIEGFMGKAINRPVNPRHSGAAADFSDKTYEGTADDQFADFLQ